MRQAEMIKQFKAIAAQAGKTLLEEQNRHGMRVTVNGRSINLGPNNKQEIHTRFRGQYLKRLGL